MKNTIFLMIGLLLYVLLMCSISFFVGISVAEGHFRKTLDTKKVPCGYTVLDNQRVILCNGDTINYKWQYRYETNH